MVCRTRPCKRIHWRTCGRLRGLNYPQCERTMEIEQALSCTNTVRYLAHVLCVRVYSPKISCANNPSAYLSPLDIRYCNLVSAIHAQKNVRFPLSPRPPVPFHPTPHLVFYFSSRHALRPLFNNPRPAPFTHKSSFAPSTTPPSRTQRLHGVTTHLHIRFFHLRRHFGCSRLSRPRCRLPRPGQALHALAARCRAKRPSSHALRFRPSFWRARCRLVPSRLSSGS